MKAAAVIITYHPDNDLLRRSIEAIAGAVEEILLWRNSESDLSFLGLMPYPITLMGDGRNVFIAKPLNSALEYCRKKGYDYLLTLDQDSVFRDFAGFRRACEADDGHDMTAVYAPFFEEDRKLHKGSEIIIVDEAITSGSLVNVAIAHSLNGFRDDYEIDSVDFEYCCWARANGYRIKVLTQYTLDHKLGYFSDTGLGFRAYNYSPVRYYHIIRNMIWLYREYRSRGIKIPYSPGKIASECYGCARGILFAEKNKWRKMCALFRGLSEGCSGRIRSPRPKKLIAFQSGDSQGEAHDKPF